MTWTGTRDPARRAAIAAGAPPPLEPLDQEAALERAILLWRRGWHHREIADALGVYHGVWATAATWRDRLRAAGVPRRPTNGTLGRTR